MTVEDLMKRYRTGRKAVLESLARVALKAGLEPDLPKPDEAPDRERIAERVAKALMTERRMFTVRELVGLTGLSPASVYNGLAQLSEQKRIAVSYRASKTEAGAGPRPMLYGAGHAHPLNAPYKRWVCLYCRDTHRMHLEDREVMCTRCPAPCQKCRQGGNGPFCEHTPCSCECHR